MTSPKKLLIALPVLLVALLGSGLWWYLRDDAPPEVSLDAAVESVDASTDSGDTTADTAGADDGDASEAATDSGIEGTWSVDAESGDFDYETATGTFVGFRIQEELASIGAATAVGRTGEVSGTLTIEGTTVTEASFEADMTAITTNESRRDDKVQQALETGSEPTATFVLTEPIELPAVAAEGEQVSVTAVGELTVHGVTRSVEIPLDAQLVDGTVVVVGSLEITFADFEVEIPTAPVVLSVEDHGTLELQLLLVKG